MSYENIDERVKEWIEEIISEDEFALKAETLYYNILHSTGDEKSLSILFHVLAKRNVRLSSYSFSNL